MIKHLRFIILTLVVIILGSMIPVQAEIIPPYGEGQIGLSAVVLCEELTMRENPSSSSKAVKTLLYGDLPNVMKQSDGWAYCVDGDSEASLAGWVKTDYIAIDPAWYRTDVKTPVYA